MAADLSDPDGQDHHLYRRFLAQARDALTFGHAHVPTILEVGEFEGRGYIVTDHADTVSLAQHLIEHGPVDPDAAIALCGSLADALDAAHDHGITHGAVGPSTLRMGSADGLGRVTGFGLGPLLELRLRRDRKRLRVVDELLYVAPEQLRDRPTTGRADQYGLACALFHALTGAPPFVRDSVGGLFGAHLFVTPAVGADAPVDSPVLVGLSKEPDERYDTCRQLIDEVRWARQVAGRPVESSDDGAAAGGHPAGDVEGETRDPAAKIPYVGVDGSAADADASIGDGADASAGDGADAPFGDGADASIDDDADAPTDDAGSDEDEEHGPPPVGGWGPGAVGGADRSEVDPDGGSSQDDEPTTEDSDDRVTVVPDLVPGARAVEDVLAARSAPERSNGADADRRDGAHGQVSHMAVRADGVLVNGTRADPAVAEPDHVNPDKSLVDGPSTAAMAYPTRPETSESGQQEGTVDDLDDIPLLSEVLSRRPPPQRSTPWTSWVLAVTVIIVVAAVVAYLINVS